MVDKFDRFSFTGNCSIYNLFSVSKGGFTQWVKEEAAKREDVTLISVDDLFEISLKK